MTDINNLRTGVRPEVVEPDLVSTAEDLEQSRAIQKTAASQILPLDFDPENKMIKGLQNPLYENQNDLGLPGEVFEHPQALTRHCQSLLTKMGAVKNLSDQVADRGSKYHMSVLDRAAWLKNFLTVHSKRQRSLQLNWAQAQRG